MIEWLRPGWLILFPLALVVAWLWWRARAGLGPWRRAVDPELLQALAAEAPARSNRLALALAVAVLALVCGALAGPTWRTQPVAMQRDAGARIVVLDLSSSMDAVDVAPTRLARARTAAAALLADAPGARLGLIVFAGDAFSVAPLTTDAALLVHLLAGATTRVMPRAGSRERFEVLQWLTFISSELHKGFSPWLFHKETADSTRQAVREKLKLRFSDLEARLAGREWLVGDGFTVADAYGFTIMRWASMVGMKLGTWPHVVAWMDRVRARPQVRSALQAEGLKD